MALSHPAPFPPSPAVSAPRNPLGKSTTLFGTLLGTLLGVSPPPKPCSGVSPGVSLSEFKICNKTQYFWLLPGVSLPGVSRVSRRES